MNNEAFDSEQRFLEALKLVSDWAKWMVTVEVGAIAVIGGIVKIGTVQPSATLVHWILTLSALSFLISIVTTSALILSVAEIAQFGDSKVNIWSHKDSIIHVSLRSLGLLQIAFFLVGVVAFAVSIAMS